jgi:predicted GIY-YIG superfamily endonuclease
VKAGTVYLLHYAEPLGVVQHYIGWTTNLPQRLQNHANGHGSATTARFHAAGIPFALARIWTGTRQLEWQLKKTGGITYCPLCKDRRREQRGHTRGQAEIRALMPPGDSESRPF